MGTKFSGSPTNMTKSTVINNAKPEYYTDKLSNCDSKDMYKSVDELLIKKQS